MAIEIRFNDGELRSVNMTDDSGMRFYMNGTQTWDPQPSSTASELRYGHDPSSYFATYLYGTFTYSSPGVPISGRVTGVLEYPGFGDWKVSITGLPNLTYNPATWDTWTKFLSVIDRGVTVHGMSVSDTLRGGEGDDAVYGNGGADLVYGNGGDDELYGGDGEGSARDSLYGGAGSDYLDGGAGSASYMYGGPGGDTYVVRDTTWTFPIESPGQGYDVVLYGGNTTMVYGSPWYVPAGIEEVRTFHYRPSGVISETPPTHAVRAGSDTKKLIGCDDPDVFSASTAATSMFGAGGADYLQGWLGKDTLDGGAGADYLEGGLGDDVYVVDDPADAIVEWSGLGGFTDGIDTVRATINFTLPYNLDSALGSRGILENLVLLGGARRGTGNQVDNSIVGNDAPNSLLGLGGSDTLSGGAGRDTLEGGSGGDTYVFDGNDTLVEAARAGVDTVRSQVNWTLPSDFENLVLLRGARDGTGNASPNSIEGNDAANLLKGLGGADTLEGGGGTDTLAGGDGDDTYLVRLSGDRITELPGGGDDTVIAHVGFTLPDEVEVLRIAGTAGAGGAGNALDNLLIGNSARNTLRGLGGDDTLSGEAGSDSLLGGDGADRLDGGAGDDTMTGGAGDDLYLCDSGEDEVGEGAGGGWDVVKSSSTFTLSAHCEVLVLTGEADLDGTGTAGDDSLVGNSGQNVLLARAGGDTLAGGAGDDRLVGGAGADSIDGAEGADTLDGGADADADVMAGGAGADVYSVGAGDSVTELDAPDEDTVVSTADWILGDHLEHLVLQGDAGLAGTGNGLANALLGNAGANALQGLAGNDEIAGGAGSDAIDGGGDDDDLSGDTGSDTLAGGDGNDSLDGGGGDDSLQGGAGVDELRGGSGDDVLLADRSDSVVDGGGGSDTLRLSVTDAEIDPADDIFAGFEAIDLGTGGGNTLHLSRQGLEAITTGGGALTVLGDATDALVLDSAYFETPGAPDGFTRFTFYYDGGIVDVADAITVEAMPGALVGTSGNDVLRFDNTQPFVAAGLGDDTLTVDGSFPTAAFTLQYRDSYFVYGFENVDLTTAGRQFAYVDAATLLTVSDTDRLKITGTSEDMLFLHAADNWQSQVVGGYVVYTSQTTGAVVEVSPGVQTSVIDLY